MPVKIMLLQELTNSTTLINCVSQDPGINSGCVDKNSEIRWKQAPPLSVTYVNKPPDQEFIFKHIEWYDYAHQASKRAIIFSLIL